MYRENRTINATVTFKTFALGGSSKHVNDRCSHISIVTVHSLLE